MLKGIATPNASQIGLPNVVNPNVNAKTSNYTLTTSDDTVTGDATGGAFTFTLPDAVANSGRVFTLEKIDSSANAITINTTSSQNIIGINSATSTLLTQQGASMRVQSDGTAWRILKSPGLQIDTFTANGTVTRPIWAQACDVFAIGAGGGGGAGIVVAASTAASGGGGGGGGCRILGRFSASDLTASISVTIGTGGAVVSSGNGNNGTDTIFGSVLRAFGGGGGLAGASAATSTGGGGGSARAPGSGASAGGGGASAGGVGTTPSNGSGNAGQGGGGCGNTGVASPGGSLADGGGPGGGSGGGLTASNGTNAGAVGKVSYGLIVDPAAGAAPGGNGGNGTNYTGIGFCGSSGGGGASATAANGGNGGNGGYGAGGGGGGATQTGFAAGSGGAGGNGILWIIWRG